MEYAFYCRKCDETFRLIESLEERERQEEKCPNCGSQEVERQLEQVHVSTSKKS